MQTPLAAILAAPGMARRATVEGRRAHVDDRRARPSKREPEVELAFDGRYVPVPGRA